MEILQWECENENDNEHQNEEDNENQNEEDNKANGEKSKFFLVANLFEWRCLLVKFDNET